MSGARFKDGWMLSQEHIFASGEADQWFVRNRDYLLQKTPQQDVIYRYLAEQATNLGINRILEVGCANGYRLNWLAKLGLEVMGFDASAQAISAGQQAYGLSSLFVPEQVAKVWCSDELITRLGAGSLDCIVFGHCLYLFSPTQLPDLVATTLRLLKPGGVIVIFDFDSQPQRQAYHHAVGVYSYKMDFSKLFTWLPFMKCIYKQVQEHAGNCSVGNPKEDCALSVVRYCALEYGYPLLEGSIRT